MSSRFSTVAFAVAWVLVIVTSAACAQTVGPAPQEVEDIYLPDGDGVRVESWAENLSIPWSLVFLPDGRALVSERPGTIRLIENGVVAATPYATLNVHHRGEGGLLGLAVHPRFSEESFVYAMYTGNVNGSPVNRAVRLRDRGRTGEFDRVILDGIPAARFHNGGRIGFGPDGMLYATTGENVDADLAPDLSTLAGKILRVTPDGKIPADNPFPGSLVYSFGHRNPQGIAWHPATGDLFASEHGPSGEFGHRAHDEINVIRPGKNYGWPQVIGAPTVAGLEDPLVVWKETTPPSGMSFATGHLLPHLGGDLFVATLGSRALVRIRLAREGEEYRVTRIERWFTDAKGNDRFGRIRDVVAGPDGAIYFLTNNTDGRGTPRPGDDRIYRIVPD